MASRPENAAWWQAVASGIGCAGWYLLANGLYFEAYQGLLFEAFAGYRSELYLPVMSLGFSFILALASCFTVGSARRYRSFAAIIATGAAFLQLITVEGLISHNMR